MPRQITKFGFRQPSVRPASSRAQIFQPTLGYDGGQAPQELRPGFTPRSQNWAYDGGYITPRSGLSSYGGNAFDTHPVYGLEGFDVEGLRHAVAASNTTLAYLNSNAVAWSALSYVAASGAVAESPDGDISNGWDGAYVYDIDRDKTIAVLTNNRQLPKFLELTPSTTTFSDFTWALSHFSQARAVAAFDNRLVWFNVASAASSFPQRVFWTARGAPTDHTVAGGAGFEDLMDMRGAGVRVVPERDGIVLFTSEEIWRGRKRTDAYAFDFYVVNRTMGCPYPRTIVRTPHGIVFLGRDKEVYLLAGDDLAPLGPTHRKGPEEGDASRIQSYLVRNLTNGHVAWGAYESRTRAYQLYFTSNEDVTNVFPKRALWYYFDNNSWFEQAFSWELSGGFEFLDIEEASTWDSIGPAWDDYNVQWDQGGLGIPNRRVVIFSSRGTAYQLHSDKTTDDGTAIDARWRSHGLGGADPFRHDTLNEVQIEAEVPSASSASVWVSPDLGNTWTETFGLALSASSNTVALAPVLTTAQSPLFEIRVADGSKPMISRLQARLRDGGLYYGGA